MKLKLQSNTYSIILPEKIFLWLLTVLVSVNGNATIYLQLLSMKVQSLEHICDNGIFPTDCDLYFQICMSRNDLRNPSPTRCNIQMITTPRKAYKNTNFITFDDRIGYVKNPIAVEVQSLPDLIHLEIKVMDADDSIFDSDDHVETFVADLNISGQLSDAVSALLEPDTGNSNFTSPFSASNSVLTKPLRNGGFAEVVYKLGAKCHNGWFGKRCDVSCVPQHSTSGHFGCEAHTGRKLCIPGWHGPNCDQVDTCENKRPCGPMGKCLNENNGFRCVCMHGFSGPLCLQPPNPCDLKKVAADSLNYAPFCLNRGFCVMRLAVSPMNSSSVQSEESTPLCICRPGFTGTRCQHEVDECARWQHAGASPPDEEIAHPLPACPYEQFAKTPCCGPDARCVNTHGSYQCICPPGWAGITCNLPPTAWPPGYHPMVLTPEASPHTTETEIGVHHTAGRQNSAVSYPTWAFYLIGFLLFVLIALLAVGIHCFRIKQNSKLSWLGLPAASTVGGPNGVNNLAVMYRPINPAKSFDRSRMSGHSTLPILHDNSRVSAFSTYSLSRVSPHLRPNLHDGSICRALGLLHDQSGHQLALEGDAESDYEELPSSNLEAVELAAEAEALAVATQNRRKSEHTDLSDADNCKEEPVWKLRETESRPFAAAKLSSPSPESATSPSDDILPEFNNMLYLEPRQLLLQKNANNETAPALPPRSPTTRLTQHW